MFAPIQHNAFSIRFHVELFWIKILSVNISGCVLFMFTIIGPLTIFTILYLMFIQNLILVFEDTGVEV